MMQINHHIPPVVITNFKVFDAREPIMRKGAEVEPIKLSYRQNMITFDFAALNFTNSNLNKYAYRLEGFDDHWINAGNKQSATFTNLDGGTYTFHVKAANNDNVWNEEGAKVMITVQSPYWETWWFYLLCALAISGLLYSAYRFRIKQLLRLQQMRLRISRDLHDDIGSTLSSINMISSMAQERNPGDRRVPELFQTISNASHQAMELMNDIVWSINPKNDRMEMILIRMRQYASEILEAAKINFSLDMDAACQHVSLPIEKRKDFYLIFKEAINNMAKYSEAQNANILLNYAQRYLVLTISDDGIGFDPDKTYSGNGLKNMKPGRSN
jgi:two-component sensor histidine kinase